MRDDAWPTLFSTQNQVIRVMQAAADDGIAASGPNSVASRRLEDMRDFYAFMVRELPLSLTAGNNTTAASGSRRVQAEPFTGVRTGRLTPVSGS